LKKLLVALLLLPLIAFGDDKSAPSVPVTTQTQVANGSDLQTNKEYTNRDGLTVHTPSKTASGKAPDGATAKFLDRAAPLNNPFVSFQGSITC
jgi:hypothetical protein